MGTDYVHKRTYTEGICRHNSRHDTSWQIDRDEEGGAVLLLTMDGLPTDDPHDPCVDTWRTFRLPRSNVELLAGHLQAFLAGAGPEINNEDRIRSKVKA